jgi:chloramphenicol 3-O phosphotransferase
VRLPVIVYSQPTVAGKTVPMRGEMIALVGTSSVGKTSVAEQLQLLLPEPYLVVGIDHFLNMFPHHWAGHPRGPGPGMWYEDTVDPDGSPRARIRYGAAGERLLAGMRAAVKAMLDCGNRVILDEMPLDESILPSWRRELVGYQVSWVHLTAPLHVVEEREARRTRGQHFGNARGHFGIGAEEEYDLRLDVAAASPQDAAAKIAATLSAQPSVS